MTALPEGIRTLHWTQLDEGFKRFVEELNAKRAELGDDSETVRLLIAEVPWVTAHPYHGEHASTHCPRRHYGRQGIVGLENLHGASHMRRRCVVPTCKSTWLEPLSS